MAKGIRALLDTVMQALPQVGNLGLLFFLLFFIFAALGVELFGRLECSDDMPCQGLGEHAHFSNFGMAFLTLFRVATGDNWNGIMKDTLRDDCDDAADCVKNCCVSTIIAPIFFVIFVLMAQFVLVNVVVAVLMKHLEESHKQMEDELDMETQLERELAAEQEELLEDEEVNEEIHNARPGLSKVRSLPANFTYNPPAEKENNNKDLPAFNGRRRSSSYRSNKPSKFRVRRRQTFHSHQRGTLLPVVSTPMHFEVSEVIKPASNLSVPRIIPQNYASLYGSTKYLHLHGPSPESLENKSLLTVTKASNESIQRRPSVNSSLEGTNAINLSSKSPSYLFANPEYLSKHRKFNDSQATDDSVNPKTLNTALANTYGNNLIKNKVEGTMRDEKLIVEVENDLDVQSVINERRPSKYRSNSAIGSGCLLQNNGFHHLFAKEGNGDRDECNAGNDVRICVEDADSLNSEGNKTFNCESRKCDDSSSWPVLRTGGEAEDSGSTADEAKSTRSSHS